MLSMCFRKGQLPKALEKETVRDEMESKAQITNTCQTSELQAQICTSANYREGETTKHCLGHSFQPWEGQQQCPNSAADFSVCNGLNSLQT